MAEKSPVVRTGREGSSRPASSNGRAGVKRGTAPLSEVVFSRRRQRRLHLKNAASRRVYIDWAFSGVTLADGYTEQPSPRHGMSALGAG